MAIFARECVTCSETTKKTIKRYVSKDEKGKYSVYAYECGNMDCQIQCVCLRRRRRSRHENEEVNV